MTKDRIGKEDRILVIGAGVFGLSSAYHLLQRGFKDVTVVERSDTIPAVDAASNDFNRVVRTAYDDIFYAQLARDAVLAWNNREEWGDTYHECGSIFYGPSASGDTHKMYENELALGCRVKLLRSGEDIRNVLPSAANVTSFDGYAGHLTYEAGWANAAQGIRLILEKVKALGGKVITGKVVSGLTFGDEGSTAKIVNFVDGSQMDADLVVVATGAWTSSLFPDLQLQRMCLATGQCVAMIQLTKEEADAYRDCPVLLDWTDGFYCFPPNEDNVVKMAIHASGFTHTINDISTPRTVTSHPDNGLAIPKSYLKLLRQELGKIYPDLAKKPFLKTRLCWYNDSPDGDFVVSFHPRVQNIVLATSGSGHAYKFLPVLGRLTADIVEGAMPQDTINKLSLTRRVQSTRVDKRYGILEELNVEELCIENDLFN